MLVVGGDENKKSEDDDRDETTPQHRLRSIHSELRHHHDDSKFSAVSAFEINLTEQVLKS